MKKALLLALTLTIATPNAHAADIKKTAYSLLKCSWHITKIGGGVLCIDLSYLGLATGLVVHRIPYVPELKNIHFEDNTILTVWFDQAIAHIKLLKPDATKAFVGELILNQARNNKGDDTITIDDLTHAEIRTAINELRSSNRNKALLACLGLFAAGSSSIWSGAQGLYDEIGSLRTTEDNESNTSTQETGA